MLSAYANEQVVRLHAVLCGTSLCKTCRAAGRKQKGCANVRCGKSLTDGIALRGLDHLKNHRDVLGHPLTFQLDRPGVVKFVEDKRDRRDVRPALAWDIHRSIVDAQVAAGEAATVLDMAISPYQTNVLDSILRLCLKPGIAPMPEDWLTDLLTNLWKKARVDFEKYPDGQFPRKTDAELAAVYEKAKNAWFASR